MSASTLLHACVWVAASMSVACQSNNSAVTENARSPAPSLARRQAPARPEARAPFGDFSVAYSDSGGAETALVLVHGWAADRRVWDEQIAPLSEAFRVLAVDLLGHGQSDTPALTYSVELLADSLHAILQHAGVQRAVLVGHSNASAVVLALQRRAPERVAGLVIVDGALQALALDQATLDGYLARYRGDEYLTHVERDGRQMFSPQLDPARREDLLDMMRAVPQHVLVSSLAASFESAAWSDAPLATPLLVLRARSPFWTEASKAFAETLAAELEYHILDGVTHYLMLDEPHSFRHLLRDFVVRRALLESAGSS